MCENFLILSKNYGDEAIFIPYSNIGSISVIKGGVTEEGTQHYSIIFYDKSGKIISENEGFKSFDSAMNSVKNMGLKIVESK